MASSLLIGCYADVQRIEWSREHDKERSMKIEIY